MALEKNEFPDYGYEYVLLSYRITCKENYRKDGIRNEIKKN